MRGLRFLAGGFLALALLAGGGEALGSSAKVPPVPHCFKKPGPCNGSYLKPGPKIPVRKVAPNTTGIYTLGWKPLQHTKPVSCGAENEGCLYNVMNWGGSIVGVISGCSTNDAHCSFHIPPGYGWQPVTVTQNSYQVAFFVVYSPPTETKPKHVKKKKLKKKVVPFGLDWKMPRRLSDDAQVDAEGLTPTDVVYPKSWNATLLVTKGTQEASCAAGERWTWKVTAPKGASLPNGQPDPGCNTKLNVSSLGTYATVATQQKRKGGSWKPTGQKVTKNVLIRDWLIAGIGDSNGSGEGNDPFYYKRCNRSEASYQYQSALYVERQDPRSSVTFIHTSCSGARIDHLYTTPYDGTRPAQPPLAPQIEQLSFLVGHGHKDPRKIDGVIMSIGVNDIGFGPLMAFCVNQAALTPLDPCQLIPVIPTFDSGNRVSGYQTAGPTAPTLRDRLADLQAQLLPRYVPLAADLQKPIGQPGLYEGLGIKPKDVFITQYPDFTNGDDGKSCGPSGLAHWPASTWKFIGDNSRVLNHTVTAAAHAHGWNVVPLDAAPFAKRGYCSSHPLFVGITDALLAGDAGGPFHPNAEAHKITAAGVEPLLCRHLGLRPKCDAKP